MNAAIRDIKDADDLKINKDGKIINSIENFETIIRYDKVFDNLRFNLLRYGPEKIVNGKPELWSDTDDSYARSYIEKEYGILNRNNLDDALRIIYREREYNPIKQEIEKVKWDGTERIKTIFIRWLKCEDNTYTREVSRLIFAGGINRLYNPGCKFDNVPVFVGTQQGEGKSSFIRWLALQDDFYNEVSEIDGQKGIEAIEGAWICELGELLALKRAKDIEAIKSYITRQTDKYRRPYDKRVTMHQRQCIFIGTTNKTDFLSDKTGNRRFLPVRIHSVGYDLFDNEAEIKADILQCWAEAKIKFDMGEMLPCPDRRLIPIIKEHQDGALEDDYREGLIIKYIEDKEFEDKEFVCIIELWKNALRMDYKDPSKKDSSDIAEILQKLGWERASNRRFEEYGCQKAWSKPLPFGQGEIVKMLPE